MGWDMLGKSKYYLTPVQYCHYLNTGFLLRSNHQDLTGQRVEYYLQNQGYILQFEIDYLSEWLPEQLSDDELEKIVDQVLSEMGDVDISQMGKVIGAVMSKGDGIDGGAVSKIVKGKLS